MPWFRKSETEKQLEQATPVSLSAYIQILNELMVPFAEFADFNHWLFSLDTEEERKEISDRAWEAIWTQVDGDIDRMMSKYIALFAVRPPEEIQQVHFAAASLVELATPSFAAMMEHRQAANYFKRTGLDRDQHEMMMRHRAAVDAVNKHQNAAVQFWLSLERLAIVDPEIHRRLKVPKELLASITPGETPEMTNAIRAQLRTDVENYLRKRR